MPQSPQSKVCIFILFALLYVCVQFAAFAQSEALLPGNYQEAKLMVDKQDLDFEAKEYVNKLFLPYFKNKYSNILRDCFSKLENPVDEPISMILILNYDGTVAKQFSNTQTNIQNCLFQETKVDQFPGPIFAPFFVSIGLKFYN